MTEVVLPDGTTRRLGNVVPTAAPGPGWGTYGAVPETPLIPRAEWADRIRDIGDGPDFPFLPPVHDQNGVGQCNADATTAVMESLRASQGLPYQQLSAADLYHRINGGSDRGSLLEDAIREAMTNGVGLAATSGTLWKTGVWKGPASSQDRGRFRLLECWLCPTFDHVMSAVLSGFRINSGIMWYANYTPDQSGWLPRPSGRGGGHAIFGYKPAVRTVNGRPEFGVWHQNSWGTRWGVGGRFVIPEAAYAGPVGGWWAGRSVVDEGGVVPPETA